MMGRGSTITADDLQRLAPAAGAVTSGRDRRALALCGGNRSKTAVFLDIPRHVLVYRIDKYELG